MAQQHFNIGAVFWVSAHTDAGAGNRHDAVDTEGLGNGVQHSLCNFRNLLRRAARHEHCKLIAGQAPHHVIRAGALAQPQGNFTQQGISCCMAQAVVPEFESIQIQEEQHAYLAANGVQHLLGALIEHGAIGQQRKCVVVGQLADAVLAGITLHCDGAQVQASFDHLLMQRVGCTSGFKVQRKCAQNFVVVALDGARPASAQACLQERCGNILPVGICAQVGADDLMP